MEKISVARHAMATRFEILLHGEKAAWLRAAGEEALDEVDRLESQLSLYRPTSEIARVNHLAAREPVRVSPNVFRLLQHAKQLSEETGGAFDITIAPLVRCWGFMSGTGEFPEPGAIAAARAKIGMSQVELNADDGTVRFAQPGVMLDLGAIGKGYAVGRGIELLREAGVTSALFHGGTSTIYGLGHPPDSDSWKVALEYPHPEEEQKTARHLATVTLRDEALSVSAIWGRSFVRDGKTYGHVLDPRTGQPISGKLMTAVALPSATETDALSTALLVSGAGEFEKFSNLRPGMRTLMLTETESPGNYHAVTRGIQSV
jgi:thiamine biosynthesis lipoprotein